MAKESSDMFPPLKAVAGAVSVLIKNYDVSAPHCQPDTSSPATLYPPPAPANIGQCRDGEGDREEGTIAVRPTCLSDK